MDDDYAEVKTFEQSTSDRLETLENEIKLIKLSIDSINRRIGRLSDSNILHHGVYG